MIHVCVCDVEYGERTLGLKVHVDMFDVLIRTYVRTYGSCSLDPITLTSAYIGNPLEQPANSHATLLYVASEVIVL